jgi:hypothetical protein
MIGETSNTAGSVLICLFIKGAQNNWAPKTI